MGQWYVRVRGQKPLGPVTTEQLAAGVGAGQVPVDAVVCRVGGSEWSPMAAYPEFTEVLRQVAPPPPDSFAPGPPPAAPAAPPPRPQVVPHVPAAAAPVPAVVHAPAPAAPVFRPPPPTPPLGAWMVIIAGPLALLALHLAVIGSEGTLPLVLLVVAAVVVGMVVVRRADWVTENSVTVLRNLARRRHVVYGALGVAVGAELLALALGLPALLWRRNFNTLLADKDPCAVGALTDVSRATRGQLARREEHLIRCEIQQREAALEAKKAQCTALVTALEKGQDITPYRELLGDFYEATASAANKGLLLKELASTAMSVAPCREYPPLSAAIWLSYAKGATRSVAPWSSIGAPSELHEDLVKTLTNETLKLSPEADKAFGVRLDDLTMRVAKAATTTDEMNDARGLCELQKHIATTQSDGCAYLDGRYQALLKAEQAKADRERRLAEAKDAAERATEEARQRREEAKEAASEACARGCDRIGMFTPAWDACTERCLGLDQPLF